jgi:hypothetical protein
MGEAAVARVGALNFNTSKGIQCEGSRYVCKTAACSVPDATTASTSAERQKYGEGARLQLPLPSLNTKFLSLELLQFSVLGVLLLPWLPSVPVGMWPPQSGLLLHGPGSLR